MWCVFVGFQSAGWRRRPGPSDMPGMTLLRISPKCSLRRGFWFGFSIPNLCSVTRLVQLHVPNTAMVAVLNQFWLLSCQLGHSFNVDALGSFVSQIFMPYGKFGFSLPWGCRRTV